MIREDQLLEAARVTLEVLSHDEARESDRIALRDALARYDENFPKEDKALHEDLIERAGGALDSVSMYYMLEDMGEALIESTDEVGLFYDVSFEGVIIGHRVGGDCHMCGKPTTANGFGKYCDDCHDGIFG
jgi:hypothetical protein